MTTTNQLVYGLQKQLRRESQSWWGDDHAQEFLQFQDHMRVILIQALLLHNTYKYFLVSFPKLKKNLVLLSLVNEII